jgi:choline-sulfatase
MNENSDYEVLIFMSDQHAGLITGYMGDPVVRTPNLDRLARQGSVFTNAYTPCPLCVPARTSFVTCRYPLDVGVITNGNALASHDPTFLHSLGIAGYETVLCGRMHFMGLDQRHGFEKRIADDITPTHWGMIFTGEPGLHKTREGASVKKLFSADNAAALHYDRYVVDAAKKYYSEDHERKTAVVVGTYMPHWPLGADTEKVAYYRPRIAETMKSWSMSYPCDGITRVRQRFGFSSDEKDLLLDCRATYYAMVESEDELVGEVYAAFRAYLDRNDKKGIFIYVSDHGDHVGDKLLNGKQTFFEHSSKIPLIIVADGFEPQIIDTPVSLLDIGETICSMTGAPALPHSAGQDLSPALVGNQLPARPIISEVLGSGRQGQGCAYGLMVRENQYKFITYQGLEDQDLLFDLQDDPQETLNVISELPLVADRLRGICAEHASDADYKVKRAMETGEPSKNLQLLSQWGQLHPEINETWVFKGNAAGL